MSDEGLESAVGPRSEHYEVCATVAISSVVACVTCHGVDVNETHCGRSEGGMRPERAIEARKRQDDISRNNLRPYTKEKDLSSILHRSGREMQTCLDVLLIRAQDGQRVR